MGRSAKKSCFGSMKGEFVVVGDIVAPMPLCLQGWEVINEPERTYDPVAYDNARSKSKESHRVRSGDRLRDKILAVVATILIGASPLVSRESVVEPIAPDFSLADEICSMDRSARAQFLNAAYLKLDDDERFLIKGLAYTDPMALEYMGSFGFYIENTDELKPKKRKLIHLAIGGGSLLLIGATLANARNQRNLGSDYMNMAIAVSLIGPAGFGIASFVKPHAPRRYVVTRFNRHLHKLNWLTCK